VQERASGFVSGGIGAVPVWAMDLMVKERIRVVEVMLWGACKRCCNEG